MRCPNLSELPAPPPGKTGWPWTEESPQLPDTMPDGNPWPRISIVTPSYNQGQFIEETIRSVLLQGYPDLEYIIMDGGSADNSVEIIRKYEKYVAYWVSEPDGGQSQAINKGWSRASGEIIAWLNSDDLYCPGVFGLVAGALQTNPECMVLCGAAKGTDIGLHAKSTKGPKNFDPARLLGGGLLPAQPAVFLRKQVFESLGGLDESLHYTMDWEYWIRIGLNYAEEQCVYLQHVLAISREWEGTKTSTGYQKIVREHLRVLEEVFALPSLPENLVRMRRHLFSARKWKHAGLAARVGDRGNARRYAIEGWLQDLSVRGLWKTARFLAHMSAPAFLKKDGQ